MTDHIHAIAKDLRYSKRRLAGLHWGHEPRVSDQLRQDVRKLEANLAQAVARRNAVEK